MIAIVGPARSGKTTALRLAHAKQYPSGLFASHPEQLGALAELALEHAGMEIEIIDDVEAATVFANCAQELLALEWADIVSGTVDPEVPGLRSPERFLESAFRLIRKLGDAAVSPSTFLEQALAAGTKFRATPPNYANTDLILATKDKYRDSLDVDPTELTRQYRREIDLAKILAKLYADYETCVRATKRMPARDAILTAIDVIKSDAKIAAAIRERYPAVLIDDAQEATPAMRLLLEAIYGNELPGVIAAGDIESATSTFRGARADALLGAPEKQILAPPREPRATLETHRTKTQTEEAAYIADAVRKRIEGGTPPHEIALIFRSVADVHVYEDALIERDIPVAVSGDLNIFADRRALDALALLWNVWDPYRHDYLIRTLRAPAMHLSDASVAALCAEPPSAQAPLFEFEPEPAPTEKTSRFDPRRDLRLGWNVVRGTADGALDAPARDRVAQFRSLRQGWLKLLHEAPLEAFIRTVWREGLARDGTANSAKSASQQLILERLFRRITAFAHAHPRANLGDVLEYAQARGESELEACEASDDPRYVQLLDIDRARGRSFEFVVIPDARAGSFPRWYVPDSFLFSPRYGMIPKDNVGDARASRTAKFSWYMHKAKTNKAYNDEERRAFQYALSRAKTAALVTASGKATRGVTAPEFLEELRKR